MKTNLYKKQRQETVTLSENFKERTLEQLYDLIDEQGTVVELKEVRAKEKKKNIIPLIRQFPAVAAIVVFALIGLLMSTYHLDKPDVLTSSEPTYGHDNEVVSSGTRSFSSSQGGNSTSSVSSVVVESEPVDDSDNETDVDVNTVLQSSSSQSTSSKIEQTKPETPQTDTDITVSTEPDEPKEDSDTIEPSTPPDEDTDFDNSVDTSPAPDSDFDYIEPDNDYDDTDRIDGSTDTDIFGDTDVNLSTDLDDTVGIPSTSPKNFVYYYNSQENGELSLDRIAGDDTITINKGERLSVSINIRSNVTFANIMGEINYDSSVLDIQKADDGNYYPMSFSELGYYDISHKGRIGWACENSKGFISPGESIFINCNLVATENIECSSSELSKLFSITYTTLTDVNGKSLSRRNINGQINLSIRY